MTDEQLKQLEQSNQLLKELAKHFELNPTDDKSSIDEESARIDEDIKDYQEKIAVLKAKMGKEGSYDYVPTVFENGAIEELVKLTVEKEREYILDSLQRNKKKQEQQTKLLSQYNKEAEALRLSISEIENRINRSDNAKNSGKVKTLILSSEEVQILLDEIEYKKALINIANLIMQFCSEEIREYGRLINQDNARLREVSEKENILASITFPEKTLKISAYARRVDEDQLTTLERAIQASENRKERLLYDPVEEIKKQINLNEGLLGKKTGDLPAVNEKEENVVEEDNTLNSSETVEENDSNIKIEEPKTNSYQEEIDKAVREVLNDYRNKKTSNVVEEELETETKEEPKKTENSHVLYDSQFSKYFKSNTDDEIEPQTERLELFEVESASEELKTEKTSTRIKKAWNEWSKNVSSGIVSKVVSTTRGAADWLTNKADKIEKKNPIITNEEVEEKKDNQDIQTKVNVDIPEVEVEQPEEGNMHTVILTTEGDYVSVPLANGELVYIDYGDDPENAPVGVTIKYDDGKMYIEYPEVSRKKR